MTIYYKDKTLPNRFKECRLKAGLSQPELSTALGFKGGKATIGCYERNLRLPNVTTLIKMKNIFDVSLDYLLCLDDYSSHIEYAKSKLIITWCIPCISKSTCNKSIKYFW